MPSTSECEVVRIGKIEKHPNADSLSITKIYDYPVIIKTEEWNEGDLAVYFPVESVLPDVSVFQFLWKEKENPSPKARMVRAIKLRGIFSMGLLIPMKKLYTSFPGLSLDFEWKEGDNLAEHLGVYKYEPPEPTNSGGPSIRAPHWMPKYTSIENVRKYGKYLQPVRNGRP